MVITNITYGSNEKGEGILVLDPEVHARFKAGHKLVKRSADAWGQFEITVQIKRLHRCFIVAPTTIGEGNGDTLHQLFRTDQRGTPIDNIYSFGNEGGDYELVEDFGSLEEAQAFCRNHTIKVEKVI